MSALQDSRAAAVSIDPADLPQSWQSVISPSADTIQQVESHLTRRPSGVLVLDELRGFVDDIAADLELWKPLVVRDPTHRRYRLAYDDDRLDLWVLSWMQGQHTGLHDHCGSAVALSVVQGAITERHMVLGDPNSSIILKEGDRQSGAAGYVHAIGHQAGDVAVTIHAYSPPLIAVSQYRAGADGQISREKTHGRQELLEHAVSV